MGFTLEDAFVQCGEQYKLTLLAGKKGCANAISWIHLIEDTTIIQNLWGKEVAVTTCLGFQNEEALYDLVKKLVKAHCTGLIINTGKYIDEVPQFIIDYCEEQDFPLITIPWEISITDVIKDFSMRCMMSERDDQEVTKYFTKAIINPEYLETHRNELLPYFDVDGTFQAILISIENSNQFDAIELRRVSFQIQVNLEKVNSKFTFFWFDSYFILIVNNMDKEELDDLVTSTYKRAKKRMSDHVIHIGIGNPFVDIKNAIRSYKNAKSAVDYAITYNKPIIYFKDMGLYQILFSVEDKDILTHFYHDQLSKLIDYDNSHHTEFEKTLYYYLKYNASPQKIASAMYTHRNTINYRITKIKQILDSELDTPEERFGYMLAFYIKDMLDNTDKIEQ